MGDRKIELDGVPDVSRNSISATAPPEKPKRNKFVLGCAVLASMNSILTGYDIGVMSGAALFIKDDLKISDTQIAVLLGILSIYSVIGCAVAGRISDWIGRRYTIVFAAVIFFVGALSMGFATNYAFLMVGRFITGISFGFREMIAPVYTVEISPAASRGFLASFPEVFINIGILIGYVSNYVFAKLPDHLNWRLMLGVGAIPAVFLGLSVLAMPESPRWLVMQGRLGKAKRVLNKISDSKEAAEVRLTEIKTAVGIPDDSTIEVVTPPKRNHGEGVWRELLIQPSPSVRRVLVAAIGIHFFQQATGTASLVLYSPRIFAKAGIKGKNDLLGATIAVGVIKTLFVLVATFHLDRVGRRPLLLISTAGMILSLSTLGFGLTVIDHSADKKLKWAIALCITAMLSIVSFFSIGIGPIAGIYCSEIFPLRLRAQGMSIGVAVHRITNAVLVMTFISMYKAMTIGGTFFLFAGMATMAWLFFYNILPETKGKTLEEMEMLFCSFRQKRAEGRHIQLQQTKTGGAP